MPDAENGNRAWVSADEIRCLVTGATGYVGGRLAPRLLDGGCFMRALARNPDKLADVGWRDQVDVVRGDLGDADSLTAAFDGIDVVYYLVHSMAAASPDTEMGSPRRCESAHCPLTRTGRTSAERPSRRRP